MTFLEALCKAEKKLMKAGVPDPAIDAELLLAHVIGDNRMELRLNAARPLPPDAAERFEALLSARAAREPLQYLLGVQCFYGLDFAVDARVLIPRQETETLCELGLSFLNGKTAPHALDLCTGSGALAVTLKVKRPDALVSATDISADALAVARGNARRNGADVCFYQGDLFAPLQEERFLLILSNPPYVPKEDCERLQPEVAREPRLALNGGADGLDFYRRIAGEASAHLLSNGLLAVEVGDGQAQAVAALLREHGGYRNIQTHQDLYGKKRIVSAQPTDSPT